MAETKRYLLKDLDGNVTHSLDVSKEYATVKPVSNNHLVIVGKPDSSLEPDKNYETSIYVGNHAEILVRGMHKGEMEILFKACEYPTVLEIDNSEKTLKIKERK